MCINCGCKMPDDTMGDDQNITTLTLAKAALASDQDGETTLRHMNETLARMKGSDIDKKKEELQKAA